jgi:hypothetical protein
MQDKLKLWSNPSPRPSWEEAEKKWEESAAKARKTHPLKSLPHLPAMPGITKETRSFLKWKSLKYLICHDKNKIIPRYLFRRPVKYLFSLLKSSLKKKSYTRDGDFFLYGIKSVEEFEKLLKDKQALLIVGFSYCHKPHECPSGRFTTACIHDLKSPICRQCFIGKTVHALPEHNVIPLFITTIHYIGEKIFEIVHANPKRQILFLITACELTLEMFGDWGNMVQIRGIGVRLDGRICNTMKAFDLSENGIKPGLTIVLEPTQKRILELLKHRWDAT